ncbi:MAG: phosphoribosylanthranilate isomerase [Methanosphaera stadtmanae]|nr:phosphoribosylanthranilate isomerase [Methanosphaera stadtmanae]
MTIKVKVCGITNEKDMKKIEKLNVNHIGFINIERSKRNISLEKIEYLEKKLINKRVGTLVLEPENAYNTIEKINRTQIFNIQLHSLDNYEIRYLKWLNQYHNCNYLNITKVIGLQNRINQETINELKQHCLYADNILLDYIKDGLTGGTNKQIPIETAIKASKIIKSISNKTQVTLAGGLNLEYLEKIQEKISYFDMIDINSGVENQPGRKNISQIKKILKIIEET